MPTVYWVIDRLCQLFIGLLLGCVYCSAQTTQRYFIVDEQGPGHRKTFFVKLLLGDEEFYARGESITKAKHAAASMAIQHSKLEQANKKRPQHSLCPTVSCQITLTPYLILSYQIALTLYPMLCCQTTLTPYLMLCLYIALTLSCVVLSDNLDTISYVVLSDNLCTVSYVVL